MDDFTKKFIVVWIVSVIGILALEAAIVWGTVKIVLWVTS